MKEENKTLMLDEEKGWIPAKKVPYYPSILEKIKHKFGLHIWINKNQMRKCLVCFKEQSI